MPPEDDRARPQPNFQLQGLSTPNRTQEAVLPAVQAALQGDLIDKPIAYLLKAAAHYEATGHLHIGSEPFKVLIQFGLGKAVNASSPFHKGEEAIMDLFTWTEGRLLFENGRQPDKVTVLDSFETLISRGQAFVSDSAFLEENNITEASFLTRAGKLSPQELTATIALVSFYKPELLTEFYGNIYGTLNLKDAAARMDLSRSKWISVTAILLRLGLLLSPEGKSLKTVDTNSLANLNKTSNPDPLPAWARDPTITQQSEPIWSLSPNRVNDPIITPLAQPNSVPLPKRANDSVTISIKKSLDEMKTEFGQEPPDMPRTASGPFLKVGISTDMASYGPSDLTLFWRIINEPETSILNREMFLFMLSHEFSRAYQFQEMLTLVVFSIKFQNAKNDLVPIEDACLIIRAVEKVKREVDLFGHFGDRSFALLLPRVDSARTCILVDRINERLPQMVPSLAEARPVLHFGLATAPADAASLSLLVKTAHANMQEAASRGIHRLQQPASTPSDTPSDTPS